MENPVAAIKTLFGEADIDGQSRIKRELNDLLDTLDGPQDAMFRQFNALRWPQALDLHLTLNSTYKLQ
jgi:hypothetical protein